MGMYCCQNEDPEKAESKRIERKIKQWMNQYNKVIKILLLGPGESGKTTIIKQMRIIHMEGFKDEERQKNVKEVRRNVLEAIKELTGNMAYLHPPVQLGDPNNQDSLDFISDTSMMAEYEYTQEFFHHVKRLWQDSGIRQCYKRRAEFQLIDSAKYFLDSIDRVSQENFVPSDQDILHCRRRTSEIQKIEFCVRLEKLYKNKTLQFCMYDVGGQRGERRKWIQVFEGITAILFVVASSGYDCLIREDNETNRLQEALTVFEEVWFSRFLRESGFILFLNKQDLLKEKIENGGQIANYFPEYAQYTRKPSAGDDPNDEYLKVRDFIKDKFAEITTRTKPKKRYSAAEIYEEREKFTKPKEFFCHYTTATDTDNVQKVFRDVNIIVMMWNLEQITPS